MFVLKLSDLLHPFNLSEAQKILKEMESHISLFGVPRDLYESLILNQDKENDLTKRVITDIVVPRFDDESQAIFPA